MTEVKGQATEFHAAFEVGHATAAVFGGPYGGAEEAQVQVSGPSSMTPEDALKMSQDIATAVHLADRLNAARVTLQGPRGDAARVVEVFTTAARSMGWAVDIRTDGEGRVLGARLSRLSERGVG